MNFSKKYWQPARLLPSPCLRVPSVFLWLHVHFNIVLLLCVCLVSFLLSSTACLYASYHRSSGIHKYWSLQRMDSCLIACSGLGNTCVWTRVRAHTQASDKYDNLLWFRNQKQCFGFKGKCVQYSCVFFWFQILCCFTSSFKEKLSFLVVLKMKVPEQRGFMSSCNLFYRPFLHKKWIL